MTRDERRGSLATSLFLLGLVLYLFTRLWQIGAFPIFFFCDEAYHQNEIRELLDRGLRGQDDTFLPLFVEKATRRWVPQITLYIYLLPTVLFGKSVLITRAVLALCTVCAPIGCGVVARSLGLRLWWLAPFVLSALPTWLLHSRTAFETTLVPSFFACFLGFYLMYLRGHKLALLVATGFAALTIYAHFSGTIIVCAAVFALGLAHCNYHLRCFRQVVAAVILGVIVLLPLLSFKMAMPAATEMQLVEIDSDWVRSELSLGMKVERAVTRYVRALSPAYWFSAREAQRELERHRWGGSPHLLVWTAPLFGIGFIWLVTRLHRREASAVLLALLASVAPSLLVEPGIMRVFTYVIPATILIVIGVELVVRSVTQAAIMIVKRAGSSAYLQGRSHLTLILMVLVAAVFSLQSIALLREALRYGPIWFQDYGLYGTQYGAQQLFVAIKAELERNPLVRIHYSVDWANNPGEFSRFFLAAAELKRVKSTSAQHLTSEHRRIQDDDLFALSAQDYRNVVESNLFSAVRVQRIIYLPNGKEGFLFVKLVYRADVDEVMRRQDIERRAPVVSEVEVGGQRLQVLHSKLDIGSIKDVFDGNGHSLARGLSSNPFILEIKYPDAPQARGVSLKLGGLFFRLSGEVLDEQGRVVPFSQEFDTRAEPDTAPVLFFAESPVRVAKIAMQILDIRAGAASHIHLRECTLVP